MANKKIATLFFGIVICCFAIFLGGIKNTQSGFKNAAQLQADDSPIAKEMETLDINEKSCRQDIDCFRVALLDEKNKCCDDCGVEAINKNAFESRQDWYAQNCLDRENHNCPVLDCSAEPSQPICSNGECDLKPTRRESPNCGNGMCEASEDKCNCSKDCGNPVTSCGNGK